MVIWLTGWAGLAAAAAVVSPGSRIGSETRVVEEGGWGVCGGCGGQVSHNSRYN